MGVFDLYDTLTYAITFIEIIRYFIVTCKERLPKKTAGASGG